MEVNADGEPKPEGSAHPATQTPVYTKNMAACDLGPLLTQLKRFEGKHYLDYLTFFVVICAALAAAAAARYTSQQVTIAKDTEVRQLRAYIGVNATTAQLDPLNMVTVQMQFKNSGSTPATELSTWNCILIGPYYNDASGQHAMVDLPPPQFAAGGIISKSRLGPGDTRQVLDNLPFCDVKPPVVRPISQDELARIRAGGAALYVYGRASYSDVFGNQRFTNYSYWSSKIGQGAAVLADGLKGNDAN